MTSGKEKTIAELIDSLITTSHRCWNFQDQIMDESLSEHERLQAAIMAQEQNAKRSQLMGAINDFFGDKGFTATKSYSYFKKEG